MNGGSKLSVRGPWIFAKLSNCKKLNFINLWKGKLLLTIISSSAQWNCKWLLIIFVKNLIYCWKLQNFWCNAAYWDDSILCHRLQTAEWPDRLLAIRGKGQDWVRELQFVLLAPGPRHRHLHILDCNRWRLTAEEESSRRSCRSERVVLLLSLRTAFLDCPISTAEWLVALVVLSSGDTVVPESYSKIQ